MSTVESLARQSCPACNPNTPPLSEAERCSALEVLPGWRIAENKFVKTYEFKDFYDVMAFANAIAYVAHVTDHHPELALSYRQCVVTYYTHAVGDVTASDAICAARIEQLRNS